MMKNVAVVYLCIINAVCAPKPRKKPEALVLKTLNEKASPQDTIYRASFTNTEYLFKVANDKENKFNLGFEIFDYPEVMPATLQGTCRCEKKPEQVFNDKIPCKCSIPKGRNIEGKIRFNAPLLKDADAFIFDPRTGDHPSQIPYLFAQKTIDESIPWADEKIRHSPGLKQWNDCIPLARKSGSSFRVTAVERHGCLVDIGDGPENAVEIALSKQNDAACVSVGILAQHSATCALLRRGPDSTIGTRDATNDNSMEDDDEDWETLQSRLTDMASLENEDCKNLADVMYTRRFTKDNMFINLRSSGEGFVSERGCICLEKGEALTIHSESFECTCRLTNGALKAQYGSCYLTAYIDSVNFHCDEVPPRQVGFNLLRVLMSTHPVSFQTTLPYPGIYSDGSTDYQVSAYLKPTEAHEKFDLQVRPKGQADKKEAVHQLNCKRNGQPAQWRYTCDDDAINAVVDFVYTPSDGLYIRYLDPATQHVATAKLQDSQGVFGDE